MVVSTLLQIYWFIKIVDLGFTTKELKHYQSKIKTITTSYNSPTQKAITTPHWNVKHYQRKYSDRFSREIHVDVRQ